MSEDNHILVPLEIHKNAGSVVAWAALIARAWHSHLTLLHVNESLAFLQHRTGVPGKETPGPDGTLAEWQNSYAQTAQLELARLVEQCGTGVSVETVLLEGRAHATILDYLEKTPCDLIVMGTHGRPWYERMVIGSTAEAVLRASTLPVLIVHNSADRQATPQLKRVLLATDFSAGGLNSEHWALQLATHGAEAMILLHVIESPLLDVYEPDKAEIDIRKLMEESRQHPPRSAQPYWEHAHHVAQAKLSLMQQQFLGAGTQIELIVREGAAAAEILRVAEEKNVDLIVMATHGRGGVRRLVLGSVTEKVIHATSRPLLAVRSE
ncbi:MAG: universal stress protein [Deltaproteobacteria bacterium]|nr:universal stress protein [Deltaproteobacteria bacterium]